MNKKHIRLFYHLKGNIELKKESFSQAIEYIKQSISLLPFQYDVENNHALYLNSLASSYYKTGDFENAQKEYEKISSLTLGRIFYGDIYAKSFYMLGKICEHKGWEGKAIEYYEKFLDLWKDADPGLPEKEDAKMRLASLQIQ